jgi:hypothetical protein
MRNLNYSLFVLACVGAAFLAAPDSLHAAYIPGRSSSKSTGSSSSHRGLTDRPPNLKGTVADLDRTAKTFTLKTADDPRPEKVYTDFKTEFVKAGKPAKFDDLAANEEAQAHTINVAGRPYAIKVNIGAPEDYSKSKSKSKSKSSKSKSSRTK